MDRQAPYSLNELLYVSGGEGSRIIQDLALLEPPQLQISRQEGAELVERVQTPFGQRIRIRAEAKNTPSIVTEVSVYDELKRVDIVNRLEKRPVRKKEAVYFAFPFSVSPPRLAYQIQNGWVEPGKDQLPGANREWFTTQNAVTARDPGVSVAWASPDAPLITLTGINRGRWPKEFETENGHVFSYAMNNYWFTNYKASQGGRFTFRYSITSGGVLDEADLADFDSDSRRPLIPYN